MKLPRAFTPDLLRRLELLRMRSRRTFLGTRQGGHASLKRGHGIEFSDYRQYDLGDDPRHIDWNAYARSERLYVKRFQEEQDLSILLLIDSSASMHAPEADGKWQASVDIALALAYVGLMQQDRITVSVPGQLHTPFFSGPAAFYQISRALQNLEYEPVKDFQREVLRAASRVRHPGVAVFISDFLMPIAEIRLILHALQSKNLDITAIQMLGPNDVAPYEDQEFFTAVDSESGEEIELALTPELREDYGVLLGQHNLELRHLLSENGISYAVALSNQELAEFVNSQLAHTGLMQ